MRRPVANPKVYRPRDDEPTGPHDVYRLFDEAGTLLYIGVTGEGVEQRVYMHLQTKTMCEHWLTYICYDSHTSQEYASKLAARRAEREAITSEAPLFNRQHNPRRWKRVGFGSAGRYVYVGTDGLVPVPSRRRLRMNEKSLADWAAYVASEFGANKDASTAVPH